MVFGGGEAGDVLRVRAADMGVSGWWRLWRGCMSVWMFQGENASLALRITAHQLLLLPAFPPFLYFLRVEISSFSMLRVGMKEWDLGVG